MTPEKVSLFTTRKDFFIFLIFCGFIFTYSLLIEYNNYKNLTKFDSNLLSVTVLKQYPKTKTTKNGKTKEIQVLKLKSSKNFIFYTYVNKKFPYSKGKTIELEVWAGKINFYQYLRTFFAYSKIKSDTPYNASIKENLNSYLSLIHNNQEISQIYQALYSATSLDTELQETFSRLGISHIFAISGFHLGILSALLYFLFKLPYQFLQNRYFPFRSYKVDSFIFISITLLAYLIFLDYPASLLRAYVMLVIGFVLHDRGFKIVSMWTLFLTALLILSFTPRLLLSIGFWLSIAGVFYIFLFLIHFKNFHKVWQFILIPFWIYIMMLPVSLFIFESFSIYHPLSIVWTSLFSIFYPLSIFLHLIGFSNLLDTSLLWILYLSDSKQKVYISWQVIAAFISLSLLSVYKKSFMFLLLGFAISIFIYAIYDIT